MMASNSGVIYVGVTNDIISRTLEHKSHLNDGFTNKYRCHKLVYYEVGNSIKDAIAREKEIKGWRRSKKVNLINSVNPKWEDLIIRVDSTTNEIPRRLGMTPSS
jgi:putative endonuclease